MGDCKNSRFEIWGKKFEKISRTDLHPPYGQRPQGPRGGGLRYPGKGEGYTGARWRKSLYGLKKAMYTTVYPCPESKATKKGAEAPLLKSS